MVSKTVDQNVLNSASPKHWVGLIIMHLLIPLVLIICGWDLGWWQGWLYSALIVVAGIGPRMWVEKKRPGLMAERGKFGKAQNVKSWDKVLAPLMAVSISFPLVIVAGLDHHFGWSPVFPTWLNILGFILIVLGYTFAGWAFTENRFFSTVVRIQTDRGHMVCDSGPYQIVRHPGYLAGILFAISIPLLIGSGFAFIAVGIYVILMLLRTWLEDKTLQEELEGYSEYVSQVRYRLFPGIW